MARTIPFCYLLIVLQTPQPATAQDDLRPLVDDSKEWTLSNAGSPCTLPQKYWTYGDTTIGSQAYHRLYRSVDSLWAESGLCGYLREDSGQVWYRDTAGNEGLLYDFTLMRGDTATLALINDSCLIYDSLSAKVSHTSTQSLGISPAYVLYLQGYDADSSAYTGATTAWYESMGSLSGLLNNLLPPGQTEAERQLSCYYHNRQLLYSATANPCNCAPTGIARNAVGMGSTLVYPNPASQMLWIESTGDATNHHYQIVSLEGKKYINGSIDKKRHPVPLTNLSEGLYLLIISDNDNQVVNSYKIVITK